MPNRFALRFENGERRGEKVELASPTVSVGRRPGSGLQILDASVSGKHAEFITISGSVHVRDLGSTNGTRVGAERISERELAHGDQVLIGNVRLTFTDGEVGEAPPLSTPVAVDVSGLTGSPEALGEEVRTISADKVERSGKRSLATAILLLLLVGGAVAGGVWWTGQSASPAGVASEPVRAVEGNLLATGYSFEGDAVTWSPSERAPVEFAVNSAGKYTGEQGLAVELAGSTTPPAGDEWALHRSATVDAPRGRGLRARAWVRVSGGAAVRLGLRFEDSSGTAGPTVVWSRAVSPTAFEVLELGSSVPAGCDRVSLEVVASGAGGVAVDDASLVAQDAAAALPSVGEYELFLLGDPGASAATLFKIDRVLLSDLHATSGDGSTGAAPAGRRALQGEMSERGFALATDASAPARLSLRAEAPLVAGGIATIGAGGYRTHQIAFEREQTTGLLLGAGRDLVRLALESPGTVRGQPVGEGFRIEVEGAARWEFQLVFREERVEARNLAHAARQAEAAGEIGASIAHWTRLTDTFPYEETLLAEAQAARARLIETGLVELRDLHQRVERARFFRLVELFRICRTETAAVATRFADTEVEAAAHALEAEILASSAALEQDLAAAEKARLGAIARALDAHSPKLAARVHEYLEAQFGEEH